MWAQAKGACVSVNDGLAYTTDLPPMKCWLWAQRVGHSYCAEAMLAQTCFGNRAKLADEVMLSSTIFRFPENWCCLSFCRHLRGLLLSPALVVSFAEI